MILHTIKLIEYLLLYKYYNIETNPRITREYIQEAFLTNEESLEELHKKVDQLLPKTKKDVLPYFF